MRIRIGRPKFLVSYTGNVDPFAYPETDYVVRDGTRSMTGELILVGDPLTALGAAPKQYVDGKLSGFTTTFVAKAGDTMTGRLTLSADPLNALHAATKSYVDVNAGGVSVADNPPGSPVNGKLWWESDTGTLWLSYNDGTSTQWVQAAGSSSPSGVSQSYVDSANAAQDTTIAGKADKTYVDSQDATLTTNANSRVLKAGDTMTGDLTITKATPSLILNKTTAVDAAIRGNYQGNARWSVSLASGNAETGSNSGSQFIVSRFADNGSWIDNPFVIDRASGSVWLAGDLTITKPVNPTLYLNKTDVGQFNLIRGQFNGSLRWTMQLGDNVAETGSDAGTNFSINRHNDAGAAGVAALTISRATGLVAVSNTFTSYNVRVNTASSSPAFERVRGVALSEVGQIKMYADGPCIEVGSSVLGNVVQFFNNASALVGSITTTASSTAYNTSSDARLKEDLKTFDAGNIIDSINVYDFKWKSTGERAYGVVAQEAAEVYDTPTFHDEKEDKWFIDYSKYVPVLLQELKALRVRVAELEGKAEAGTTPSLSQTAGEGR